MKKSFILTACSVLLTSGLALAEPTPSVPVNINTADQAALAAVPGIGKHKAKAIVSYRNQHGPFKEVHDLTHVKGLNEKKLQTILKHNPEQLVVK